VRGIADKEDVVDGESVGDFTRHDPGRGAQDREGNVRADRLAYTVLDVVIGTHLGPRGIEDIDPFAVNVVRDEGAPDLWIDHPVDPRRMGGQPAAEVGCNVDADPIAARAVVGGADPELCRSELPAPSAAIRKRLSYVLSAGPSATTETIDSSSRCRSSQRPVM
jgi:hypothetical protein